jgi:cytochrome c oxidase cbb3-type subunit 3/ubiquinol-cytochrome c reductase cytochrome c subunit
MHRSPLSIAIACFLFVACARALCACGAPGEGATAPRRAPASKSAAEVETESATRAAPGADPHGGAPTATPAVPAPAAPAERGQQLYAQMCAVCHGANGEGYKADQATALAHPDFLASVNDEFLRLAIVNGRKKTTMSAWAQERGGPLAPADVDALIAFLRTWDKQPRAELDRRELTGDPERGEAIYRRECARCHGARGRGGPNVNIGDPELFTSAGLGFLRLAIHNGRTGTSMPAYGEKLGDRGIDDVLAYLLRVVSTPEDRIDVPVPVPPPPIPLGPVPLNPKGPEPDGFARFPGVTSVDVVHAQLKRGARMALLDARAPSDYANEHIAGAVSVPFYDPSPYLKHLPRNAWLVSYCACPHAESKTLAQKLTDAGFTKVTVLNEGLGVWKARGYPVHTGRKP